MGPGLYHSIYFEFVGVGSLTFFAIKDFSLDLSCYLLSLQDLPRTFPGHPALDENGRSSLRRVLLAYARHNPSVGYCQVIGKDYLCFAILNLWLTFAL